MLFATALVAAVPASAQTRQDTPLYKNPSAPVEQRVEDLLSRMTLEEKIAQITTVWTQKSEVFNSAGEFDAAKARQLHPAGIGHFARPSDLTGTGNPYKTPYRDEKQTVALVNAIQKWSVNDTRLGIPTLFHEEGLHGYAARGATHFPQAIALASSWDPELLTRVFTVAGREIRARGVQPVLAPVVDVARDPRWGRIEETYGEDPYLVGELGVAAVRGFQGDSLPLAKGRVLATLKHMTGHGQPEGGTNVGPSNTSERVLREFFFPPFEAAVKRANAQSVMPSYNEIDGVPSHANAWLLNQVLRKEMGFQGSVVSDYWGIDDLQRLHFVEPDLTHAAARALRSGVDFDLPDGSSFSTLPQALAAGLVTEADIDQAVRRMLRLKFLAGLFEQPYADAKYAEAITDNAEARALAEEAARKSVVLLKNDGVLPLRTASLKTLAVIGPNAAVAQLGGYSNVPTRAISLGKPVVAVLINGRPQAVVELAQKANALVEGWYLGQEGGTALADILFGDANPGGKLPVTIPRSAGQLPMTYNEKPSAHRGYLFDSRDPLFPFGFGLSYTTFDIGAPKLAAAQIPRNGAVTVSVEVRNTGKVAGDEVVQLYLRDVVSSVTRPRKELKGFKRVTLAPGASTTVTFTLDSNAFSLWDKDMKRVVEPGDFHIMVGPSSVDLKSVTLTVTS